MGDPTKSFEEFQAALPAYLSSLRERTEATRRQRFLDIIRDFFGVEADELESTLSVGGIGARVAGRIDALAGNVILEFKDSLTAGKLDDARNQLRRYAGIFHDKGDARRYTLIATDGASFQAFYWDGKSPGLTESTAKFKLDGAGWQRSFFWLDDWIASRLHGAASPDAESIAKRLGTQSPSYLQGFAILESEWDRIKGDHKAAYSEWEKSIVYVYGSNLASSELFLRHTYITTVAKVLMAAAIMPDEILGSRRTDEEVQAVVVGDLFRRFGIMNFGEHDFFAWIAESTGGVELTRGLLLACGAWDFHQIKDDLMRNLYEELIDPETRRDLGEFYTPPWVAQLIVEEAAERPDYVILDPACGSGTFLVAAIMRKIAQGRSLTEILAEVVGIDIHPVAVIVARASYLLAIRSLLRGKARTSDRFSIPVYMSDSIRPREARFRSILETGGKVKYYELTVLDEKDKELELSIPAAVVEGDASQAILDAVENSVRRGTWSSVETIAKAELERATPKTAAASLALLQIAFEQIHRLHTKNRNGIQVFLLRNYFRPTLLEGKVDRVVGNPPWLAFRYLKDPAIQASVKTAYRNHKLNPIGGGAHLVTQLDISPLFFEICGKRYLKPNGKVRFLLPRTVFNSDQFSGFRGNDAELGFDKVWDFARVRPLFTVQCCGVGAVLGPTGRAMRDPIPAFRWEGSLENRDSGLADAKSILRVTTTTVSPVGPLYNWAYPEQDRTLLVSEPSVYYKAIENGATIYPYPLVLVDIVPDRLLGFDPSTPPVRTGTRALRQAKPPWNEVRLSGKVEARFLYSAVTGSEVVPFGNLALPVAALPFVPNASGHGGMVQNSTDLATGSPGMAKFFGDAEVAWLHGHQSGRKKGTGPFADQVNFRGKLASQELRRGYFVVIPTSARLVLACVVKQGGRKVQLENESVSTQATIVEGTNNYLYTTEKSEAHYLAAILNSDVVNSAIKSSVLKGLDTERHTYREPLAIPIPKFDEKKSAHRELAELGEKCAMQAKSLMESDLKVLVAQAHIPSKLSKLRVAIRSGLTSELEAIDKVLSKLLAAAIEREAREKPAVEKTEEYVAHRAKRLMPKSASGRA